METDYHWMYGCTVNDVKILAGILREFDSYNYTQDRVYHSVRKIIRSTVDLIERIEDEEVKARALTGFIPDPIFNSFCTDSTDRKHIRFAKKITMELLRRLTCRRWNRRNEILGLRILRLKQEALRLERINGDPT